MNFKNEISNLILSTDKLLLKKEKFIKETNLLTKQLFLEKNIDQLRDLYKETLPLISYYELSEQLRDEWRRIVDDRGN